MFLFILFWILWTLWLLGLFIPLNPQLSRAHDGLLLVLIGILGFKCLGNPLTH